MNTHQTMCIIIAIITLFLPAIISHTNEEFKIHEHCTENLTLINVCSIFFYFVSETMLIVFIWLLFYATLAYYFMKNTNENIFSLVSFFYFYNHSFTYLSRVLDNSFPSALVGLQKAWLMAESLE